MISIDCFLVAAMILSMPTDDQERLTEPTRSIFTFETENEVAQWYPINDGVMGGLSEGRVAQTGGKALCFSGEVSLDNNGGFASVRSRPRELDLSVYSGVLVRVRGDGQRYALNIQTDVPIRAGSYRCKFDTVREQWVELYFPFEDFCATSFGVELPDALPFDPRKIRSFGLLISDKQAGPFQLEVDWIRAVARH